MGLTCLLHGHDWDGCTCRRCKKVRDEGHKPMDYTYYICDVCNDYHYLDVNCDECGCTGLTKTVTFCAVCGRSVIEEHHYMDD